MLKEEKNVFVKKNRDVRGGNLEEARGCNAEGTMSLSSQTSLGSLRDAPVLNFNAIERLSEARDLNWYFFLYLLA